MKPHINITFQRWKNNQPEQLTLGFDFEQQDTACLPCPFCGHQPLIYVAGQVWAESHISPDNIQYLWGVECPICHMGHIGHFDNYDEARRAWNKRA